MQETDYLRVNLLAKLSEGSLVKNNYQEAINYIDEFFDLKKRNSFDDLDYLENPCYFNRGLSYFYLGNYPMAITDLNNYILNDTSNFDAYFLRLRAYFELDDMDKAIPDIKKALGLDPTRGDLYTNLGIAYIKKNDRANARLALQQAVQLGFKDAQTYIDKYC
jgi:tetratricopeptide (TPR) repeat protein